MMFKKIISKVHKHSKNQAGNVAVMFAVAAVPLIGVAGVAVDYIRWERQYNHMQVVADAASLAAINTYISSQYSKKSGSTQAEADAVTTAKSYIATHAPKFDGNPAITVTDSPPSVTVQLNANGTRTLSKILGSGPDKISTSATAVASANTGAACVIGLEPLAAPAVEFKMSGTFAANGCAVWSNSTQATSLSGSGSGTATASKFCAAGGVQVGSTNFSVAPEANCKTVTDPFADLNMPAIGMCTFTNFTSNDAGTIYLNPGVYCGGIKLNGQGSIQLSPGNYIIKDGNFSIVGGSSIEGSDITFFLTGANSGLKFGGAATINIKAPTTGDYAGIAIFSDRNSPVDASNLRGSSSLDIEGAIYLPNHDLSFSGSSSALLPANYTVLIARTVSFEGSSDILLRSDFGASNVPVPQEILETRLTPRLSK